MSNIPQTPQITKEKTDRSEHIKKQEQNLFTPKAHLGEKKGKDWKPPVADNKGICLNV